MEPTSLLMAVMAGVAAIGFVSFFSTGLFNE